MSEFRAEVFAILAVLAVGVKKTTFVVITHKWLQQFRAFLSRKSPPLLTFNQHNKTNESSLEEKNTKCMQDSR